ncbi:hypothetical protein [Tateyamaria sp. ANG-S1]|uniref:hypothetical protein n=1 Tax=Tateyamaria sp. ANG-S1 TaxID=1577905 RepID=UPI00187CAA01|nr:hypothetical protein [Tateyamaria sp. ANG-S1]
MKRPIIAAVTALALVVGLTSAVSATTVSFPPDISTADTGKPSPSSDRSGSSGKYK